MIRTFYLSLFYYMHFAFSSQIADFYSFIPNSMFALGWEIWEEDSPIAVAHSAKAPHGETVLIKAENLLLERRGRSPLL